MTTILITPEPIPVALTAEQVVAYLLRPGSGWREDIGKDATGYYRIFKRGDEAVSFATYGRGKKRAHWLTKCILDIARVESRPAEQVAADIAGPAVGIGGVGCERPLTADEWWAGQMRPLCRQTETCSRVASRAPEVE